MIVKELLPIKAHFFFFMAALGPVLPQLQVFGKNLGISSVIMGTVTGVLPFVYLVAKPLFGMVVDLHRDYRKTIFVGLIMTMAACYGCMTFIPNRETINYELPVGEIIEPCENIITDSSSPELKCLTEPILPIQYYRVILTSVEKHNFSLCVKDGKIPERNTTYTLKCENRNEVPDHIMLTSSSFWIFVILMSIGTIAFNVVNSVSDAICFDVIGQKYDYGKQRSWGAVGYGTTALLTGYAIDYFSMGENFFGIATGAMLLFVILDLLSCAKLDLPPMPGPDSIWRDLGRLMGNKAVRTFLVFTVLIGAADGFLTYFLFWYIEDIAKTYGTENVKLLEGAVVAAGTFGGSILFFHIGDNILKKLGHVRCFSFCFLFYSLRLFLISIVPTPWTIVAIEFVLQGPTFALTYITIVAYANEIAPPGASATMQGIAAGLDDGLGYAVGSLLGGILYRYAGPRSTFQIFSLLIASSGMLHYLIQKFGLQESEKPTLPEEAKFVNGPEKV
ncbi:uncharacterized protein LOC123320508 [Coccinella septempunctata]|uniref:uncharacterized protein LOC123320508 n=1 Tax=Coccinella septempunctata TaxID=41139 RepID=UPI001D06FB1C|nr:uncharacterized protein LOC123320508 [Coccinella septempunctata]